METCPRCDGKEFIYRRDALGQLHELPCPECCTDDNAEAVSL